MGSRGKVRRPCSAQCAEYERDELFVKSQASRFQKNQNQPTGPVSVRFAPVESLTIRWNNGRSRRSASRRALKIEQNKTTRVEKPVSDDYGPKISPRRKNQQSHQNTECAGDSDAERILVSVRCSEQRPLQNTSANPRAAASTKQHRQALHEKSTKGELLIKPGANECIQHGYECEFRIPLHILELAEVATKPRLFRKIDGDENNCGEPNADHQCARPTLRLLQSDVGQSLAAQ